MLLQRKSLFPEVTVLLIVTVKKISTLAIDSVAKLHATFINKALIQFIYQPNKGFPC